MIEMLIYSTRSLCGFVVLLLEMLISMRSHQRGKWAHTSYRAWGLVADSLMGKGDEPGAPVPVDGFSSAKPMPLASGLGYPVT